MLTIAIAKGRMQESALALLGRAGIRLSEDAVNSRRLAIMDETGQYRFIFGKPADVPVYVEHGIADCGVVGRDVLLESQADLLLPLDLGIARCRIVVAAARAETMTRSLGMLPIGRGAEGELLVPLAQDEAIWLGVSPLRDPAHLR